MNIKSNVQNEVICIYDDGRVMIDLPCILTPNRIVRPDMLLLKVEGRHVDVVKLISVKNTSEIVYLKLINMKTGLPIVISSTLDPDETFPHWWLLSYEYVLDHFEDRVLERFKGTEK